MIRPYQKEDTDTIIDIWLKASELAHPFLKTDFIDQEKKNIREIYLPNTITWVYLHEDQPVGFISMIGNEVGAIFLYPALHGKGFGRKMMDRVAQDHPDLEVEVFEKNTIGQAFYHKYGFKQIKRHIHPPTQEALLRLKFEK